MGKLVVALCTAKRAFAQDDLRLLFIEHNLDWPKKPYYYKL